MIKVSEISRLRGSWLLVESDPRMKKTKGGIELPEQLLGIERVMEGTGVILKVSDDKEKILEATGGEELTTGMRVLFRGFLKDAFDDFEELTPGRKIFLIKAEDIMGIVDESVTMGAFS